MELLEVNCKNLNHIVNVLLLSAKFERSTSRRAPRTPVVHRTSKSAGSKLDSQKFSSSTCVKISPAHNNTIYGCVPFCNVCSKKKYSKLSSVLLLLLLYFFSERTLFHILNCHARVQWSKNTSIHQTFLTFFKVFLIFLGTVF